AKACPGVGRPRRGLCKLCQGSEGRLRCRGWSLDCFRLNQRDRTGLFAAPVPIPPQGLGNTAYMIALVRIALSRPYTFVVLALLLLIIGPLAALRTPTDIFPEIRIPVIGVVWQYTGLRRTRWPDGSPRRSSGR